MKKIFLSTGLFWMLILPLKAGAEHFSVFADWLIWQPSEESTTFWANGSTLSNPAVLNPPNISFGYSHGFRGGILYEPNQFWNFKFYWTYLPGNQTMNIETPDQVLVPGFFSGFLSGNFFFGSQLNWTLYLNTLDLEASHAFHITPSLSFSPMIGIKGGSINQNITSTWNAFLYVANENVLQKYTGIGPSLGISGQWNFMKDFNLVGNFSTAFMYGTWNIDDVYTRPSVPAFLISPTTISTRQNNISLGTLTFDYFLGLEWAHQGKVEVKAKLGYEIQYWTNQLRIPTFQLLPVRGDLTLQGATCGISIGI